MAVPERQSTMSQPKDRRALLAKAKAKAMDRFLRDYDDYAKAKAKAIDDYCDRAGAEPDVQFILNLEIDDDA